MNKEKIVVKVSENNTEIFEGENLRAVISGESTFDVSRCLTIKSGSQTLATFVKWEYWRYA